LAKKFSIRRRASWRLAVGLGRDHGRLAGPRERLDHPLLGVERPVRDQRVRGEVGRQGVGAVEVVRPPGRERGAGRVAERVDRGVDLGARPAPAAPDRLPGPPPF
jgi:hypothetical protein